MWWVCFKRLKSTAYFWARLLAIRYNIFRPLVRAMIRRSPSLLTCRPSWRRQITPRAYIWVVLRGHSLHSSATAGVATSHLTALLNYSAALYMRCIDPCLSVVNFLVAKMQ